MNKDKTASQNEDGEEQEMGNIVKHIIAYLQSEKGHDLVEKGIVTFAELKDSKQDNQQSFSLKLLKVRAFNYRYTLFLHVLILAGVISTASILTLHDKFNSTLGVFFGTVLGYIFGKQSGK